MDINTSIDVSIRFNWSGLVFQRVEENLLVRVDRQTHIVALQLNELNGFLVVVDLLQKRLRINGLGLRTSFSRNFD